MSIVKNNITIITLISLIVVTLCTPVAAQKKIKVQNLATDLVYETDIVYQNGFATDKSLDEYLKSPYNLQVALIHTKFPHFSWQIIDDKKREIMQIKYRLLLASKLELLEEDKCDVWDSGIEEASKSSGVESKGNALNAQKLYYWKVKISTKENKWTKYSEPKSFVTASQLDCSTAVVPLQKTEESPIKILNHNNKFIADFGKDAFSQVKVKIDGQDQQTLTIKLGEEFSANGINERPSGTRSYKQYQIVVGQDFTSIPIAKPRSTANVSGVSSISMPKYIGEVLPLRYCQIEGYNGNIEVVRTTVNYAFDDRATIFESSDTILNQVFQLCKHSIKATSFAGIFVDGDRERIPYEADALINQLGWYCLDNHYSIARKTLEHLIKNPTWPTEWILQTVIMAWYDYLYTGDDNLLRNHYNDLKNKTLMFLRNNTNGLIYTGDGITNEEYLEKVNFQGRSISDIVDWPVSERDGFVMKKCNTVVNAYHYYAMDLMSRIAMAIGNETESAQFSKMAQQTRKFINTLLLGKNGLYIDGIGTEHNSLHSNMFPLAFVILPDSLVAVVIKYVESRQMACSVYGAQFLMDAVYDSGMEDYGFKLLTNTDTRSWYNMIRVGSTITTETWDDKFKNNQDWTHAWGAVPANTIVRKLMGIEPLTPGFADVMIAPKPSSLQFAKITVPTPKGIISVSFENSDSDFEMSVSIPPNMTAHIQLPGDEEIIEVLSGEYNFYKKRRTYTRTNSNLRIRKNKL